MNINSNPIKTIVVSILSIAILFLAIMFFQNSAIGTTMIVTMNAEKKTVLQPKIYFAGGGEALSEERSNKNFKIENNQYYFSLPETEMIKQLRLDPSTTIDDILISNIVVVESKWFKTTLFKLSLQNTKPLTQIKDYQQTDEGIKFLTVGNDPQLDIPLALEKVSTAYTLHLDLFLISVLIFMVCTYLYKIAITREFNDFLTAKLILYTLFFALALFKADYYKDHVKFGYPPDELAHLSYIDHVHTHDDILPKFETMVMLNNRTAGNYLGHPPLYYEIMDLGFDKNYSILKNVNNFRTLTMIIFIASFLLLLYIGFNADIGLLGHFVYLSFISSVPMYAYLGASINNDTLAILGSLIFVIGLKRAIEQDFTSLTYLILGIGVFVTYFSKFTAALLIFFAIIFFLIYAIKTKINFKINRGQITLLLLFMLPIFYYQFYILSHYHSIVPTFNVTFPGQYLKSAFFIPEEHRQHLGVVEWLGRIRNSIISGWFGIHSHHSLEKDSVWSYIGLLILHILAIVALFFKCSDDTKSYCIIGKIALLSLFSVLFIQYTFSCQAHLKSGYLGGLQPRYVLPFMFSFAIMASIFVERFKHFLLFDILIILICMQAIYSDFFYFLQYYH